MKKITAVAAAALSLGVVVIGIGAGAAEASDTSYRGAANRLTLFDDTNYNDRAVTIEVTRVDDLDVQPYGFNDKTTSFVNKTSRYVMVYDDAFERDTHFCIKPHSHGNDLRTIGFGDKISSLVILGQTSSSCGGATQIGATN